MTPHYQIVVDRVDNLDQITVAVELSEEFLGGGEVRKIQAMSRSLTHRIKEFLGVSAQIRLVEPRTLARSEGKAQRVIDQRKDKM